jgi:anti-sigma regulatory factor (Ser/Thr protein kinase)
MKKKFILQNTSLKKNYLKEILSWFEIQIKIIFPDKFSHWIPNLCFEEFVTNIFLYSNLPFPSRFVVEIAVQNDQLIVRIEDEGDFYDINAHLNHHVENQIGGCGIRLIKSYMSVQQLTDEKKNITKLILPI